MILGILEIFRIREKAEPYIASLIITTIAVQTGQMIDTIYFQILL